jgi:AraC-like DNA-binding protein
MSAAAVGGRGTHLGAHQPCVATPWTRRTTDERDEAEHVITELYLPNRIELPKPPAPLGMELTGLKVGALTVGRLTFGRRVQLRTADADNFHVNIPLHGRASSRRGRDQPVTTGPGEGLVFSPGAPAEISWSAGCDLLCLMISRARLEAELEQLLGTALKGPLTFDFAADLRSPLGRRWRALLELLVDELDDPTDIGQNPLVGRHLEGLVLDGLLLGQPHSHSGTATRESRSGPAAAISRAVELIEDRPSEPWTTVRLAAEVHLSVRALQAGFRRHLAATPMIYLRQVRLRRAREALEAADRDATTVRAVAVGLGIWHMSRFAAAYREAFGEAPSDTLNRPRSAKEWCRPRRR